MRIKERFEQLRKREQMAYMPYLCLGDPDQETSIRFARELCNTADLLEVGFPFSDPIADGPTLQIAATRALKAGATTDKCFQLIKEIRRHTQIPIIAMAYYNLVFAQGMQEFLKKLSSSGADGIIVPDLPVEDAGELKRIAEAEGIDTIFIATPGTKPERLKEILVATTGFLYLLASEGTTGARENFDERIVETIKTIKSISDIPIAAGFGISNQAQAANLRNAGVDGIIIGSRIADIYSSQLPDKKRAIQGIGEFSRELFESLK